jgi:hypothetical protein
MTELTAEQIRRLGVHRSHCCAEHGCKYGDDSTCPVVLGEVIQDYPCEMCGEEKAEFEDHARRVTSTPEAFANYLSKLSNYTNDHKIISAVAVATTMLRGY